MILVSIFFHFSSEECSSVNERGKRELVRTELGTAEEKNALPGIVLCIERERGILVKCKEGSLWLCEVHPAGKKPMPALAFANGRNLKPGDDVFKE